MDAIRTFFCKIRALIFDFHERAGEASHLSPHSCACFQKQNTNYHAGLEHKWHLFTSCGKNKSLLNKLKTKVTLNKVILIIPKVLDEALFCNFNKCYYELFQALPESRFDIHSVLTIQLNQAVGIPRQWKYWNNM